VIITRRKGLGFSNYFVQYLIPDSEDDVGVCAVFGVVDGVSGGF
jgi:hypothetical protein